MIKIELNDWITSSNSYPERANSSELTDVVKTNAQLLCDKINNFLNELNWQNPIKLSSGFRPIIINNNTPGAAKHSGHENGHAMDLLDDHNQTLCKLVQCNPDLLRKHGLMMEDPKSTIGKNTNWTHLDTVWRPDRPSRVFIP